MDRSSGEMAMLAAGHKAQGIARVEFSVGGWPGHGGQQEFPGYPDRARTRGKRDPLTLVAAPFPA